MVFGRIFSQKGEREYLKALEAGEWAQAVSAARSHNLPADNIKTAEYAQEIARQVQAAQGPYQVEILCHKLYRSLQDPAIAGSLPKDERNLYLTGAVRRAVTEREFNASLALAHAIQEKDAHSLSLRLIAGSPDLDTFKRMEVLKRIPLPGIRDEQLRNLAFAQVFAGHPEKAIRIGEAVSDSNRTNEVTLAVARYFSHEVKDQDIKNIPIYHDAAVHAIIRCIRHIREGRLKDCAGDLETVEGVTRNNVIVTLANSLAGAGNYDDAFAILGYLPDNNFRFMTVVNVLTEFPVSEWPKMLYETLPGVGRKYTGKIFAIFPATNLFNPSYMPRIRDLPEPYRQPAVLNFAIMRLATVSALAGIDPASS